MKKRFELIDDITMADIAFKAYGKDINDLFNSSALALLSIMLEDPCAILNSHEKYFEINNSDLEFLLFEFLQEFIFYKDAEFLLLKPVSIVIEEDSKTYFLKCSASGEMIDRGKHSFNVDIKAVTMHKFEIQFKDGIWESTVVVDV